MKHVKSILSSVPVATTFCSCSNADFKMIDDGHFNAAGIHVLSVEQGVDVQADAPVDILFVIDNSASMKQEQVNFGAKIDGFMSLIKDLNWHIALTTTDSKAMTKDAGGAARAWSDGQLRPFDSDEGKQYVLKSDEISATEAQVKLAAAIQVGLLGSGDERGVNAAYRAIERSADTAANAGFFRANARLAVVLISDENECSNGSCLSTSPKSVPANLVSLVQSTWGRDKIFTFNSIAKMAADTKCTTAAVASVYEEASNLTGGVTGSVCSNDYTTLLSNLGNRVVELVDSMQLSCLPEDMNGDGIGDVSIISTAGQEVTTPFKLTGARLTLSSPLAEGHYRLQYHCMPQ